MPAPTAWAQGLSSDKQAEWLVDCYRMRLDDDYAIGGRWEVLRHTLAKPTVGFAYRVGNPA